MKKKSTQLRKRFGEQVRKLRNERGLSQEELAFCARLDRTYISGIERGIRNPSLDNIGKIAKALKVSLLSLFDF
ncbi:MAG: helix-turn-helix domain-containing protein [Candidatus Heimdallarchaeaceae archaeon]